MSPRQMRKPCQNHYQSTELLFQPIYCDQASRRSANPDRLDFILGFQEGYTELVRPVVPAGPDTHRGSSLHCRVVCNEAFPSICPELGDGFAAQAFDAPAADNALSVGAEDDLGQHSRRVSGSVDDVGDVVDGSVGQLRAHTAPLGGLHSRHGSYMVTGNHECYPVRQPGCASSSGSDCAACTTVTSSSPTVAPAMYWLE